MQTQAHRVAATDGRRAASVTEVSERRNVFRNCALNHVLLPVSETTDVFVEQFLSYHSSTKVLVLVQPVNLLRTALLSHESHIVQSVSTDPVCHHC